ncbi:MAG: sugar kinase [Pseudomonadota bacterium]
MTAASVRIAAIGECMIELGHVGGARIELAFGGDTLNTAVYLARLGEGRWRVDYATALGDDPYSDSMRKFFVAEGLGVDLVVRLPGRLPGLYAIRTAADGERQFHYWRSEAAARAMFDEPHGAALAAALPGYSWLYLSGITLSILAQPARERLIAGLDAARRAGAKIAFDPNYRPRGWANAATARAAIAELVARVDVALPTFGDECALFGDTDPAATVRRLHALGVGEVAVKNGSAPAVLSTGGATVVVPAPAVARVIDTTAAGDAFNAGYLAGRIGGADPRAAARRGHRLASAVIAHHGAIIARSAMPAASRGRAWKPPP